LLACRGGNRTPHVWGDSETWLLNYQVQTKQRAGPVAQQQGHWVGMHVKYPPESINAKVPYMHKQGAPFRPLCTSQISPCDYSNSSATTTVMTREGFFIYKNRGNPFSVYPMLSFKFNLFVIRRSCPLATPNCRLSVSASVPKCIDLLQGPSETCSPTFHALCHFEPWGTCCWCNSKFVFVFHTLVLPIWQKNLNIFIKFVKLAGF